MRHAIIYIQFISLAYFLSIFDQLRKSYVKSAILMTHDKICPTGVPRENRITQFRSFEFHLCVDLGRELENLEILFQ